MKIRGLAIGLLCTTVFCQSGCIFINLAKESVPKSLSELQPMDYREPIQEGSDKWLETASKEGRGDRPRELVADGWIDRWTKSPKARSIENNMGIDFR